MKYINMAYLVFAVLFFSCQPDQYALNVRVYQDRIYGFKMTGLDDVDVLNDNSILIRNSGRTALAVAQLTQLHGDFTVELNKGEGIRFAFRTVSKNYDQNPAIYFNYTVSGCQVKENERILTSVDSIKAKIHQPERIQIKNSGDVFLILAGCDTVYYGRTHLPATEYVILESILNSEVILSGIQFANVNDEIEKK